MGRRHDAARDGAPPHAAAAHADAGAAGHAPAASPADAGARRHGPDGPAWANGDDDASGRADDDAAGPRRPNDGGQRRAHDESTRHAPRRADGAARRAGVVHGVWRVRQRHAVRRVVAGRVRVRRRRPDVQRRTAGGGAAPL